MPKYLFKASLSPEGVAGVRAGGRTAAGRLLDPTECVVDAGDREHGNGGRRDVEPERRRPADTDAALPRLSGQEPDGRLDLMGREPTEEIAECRNLRRAGARRSNRVGRRNEVGEQHTVSVPDSARRTSASHTPDLPAAVAPDAAIRQSWATTDGIGSIPGRITCRSTCSRPH